jgi:two-component sensor histidine kinase
MQGRHKHQAGDRFGTMQVVDTTAERLRRQRAGLAYIGACALRTENLDELLNEACRIVATGLGTRFCKILEFRPETSDLLVRAGVGWAAGVVGHARLSAGTESPAGYALKTGQPVICNDLATETRFRTPALLVSHGISRAGNVLIRGDGESFGVLEVDSRGPDGFTEDDTAFLQAAANLLGIALERARRRQELEVALAGRDLLAREADHRIKNSLQLTASLLTLQRSRLADSEACAALDDAIARVQAVAAIHRVLHDSADLHTVAFGRMLADLCQHVGALGSGITIRTEVDGGLPLDAERAIPLGLIVSELLTNVVRHAYPEGGPGDVNLRAGLVGEQIEIVVADHGTGFAPAAGDAPSLGTMIVRALARQIGAELEVASQPGRGTIVALRLPRAAPMA